jgi:hypothetical protein
MKLSKQLALILSICMIGSLSARKYMDHETKADGTKELLLSKHILTANSYPNYYKCFANSVFCLGMLSPTV